MSSDKSNMANYYSVTEINKIRLVVKVKFHHKKVIGLFFLSNTIQKILLHSLTIFFPNSNTVLTFQ